jgi:hypothetical protein
VQFHTRKHPTDFEFVVLFSDGRTIVLGEVMCGFP